MDARRVFAGDADGRFERVVCGAVLEDRLDLEGLGPDVLVGRLPEDGRRVIVVRGGPGARHDLARVAGDHASVLFVGGAAADAPDAAAVLAEVLGPHEPGWLVTDAGEVLPLGESAPAGPALGVLTDTPPDWPRFWAALQEKARAAGPPPELRAFVATIQARRPVVTVTLAVVIVAVYLLGATFGAPELPPALLRMGALQRERVLDGEVWRLVSATFLHGGLLHLAANTYVLWILGRQLERILGSARFLVLYALSGIGGSLLSLVFLDGVSVGASGAIWGLMSAMLVLSLQRGILPESYRVQLRSGLLQTFLINAVISLAPGIDWAAHAGGGIVGAGLVGSGLLTSGMPRWATAEGQPTDRVPAWARVGAPVAGVVLAVGLLTAIVLGKPWSLGAPLTLAPTTVGAWALQAPAGLPYTETTEPPGVEIGSLEEDMGQIAVTWAPGGAMSAAERDATTAEIERRLAEDEGGMPRTGEVERSRVDGADLVEARYRVSGARYSRAVVVGDAAVVWVEVLAWSDAPAGWDDLARTVALSVRPVEAAVK